MQSIVTAKSVKSFVKALRVDVVPEMKHTQVLDVVAEALGWKADALMHRLKTQQPGHMVFLDENAPLVQDFEPIVLASAIARRGREFDAYRMAKMFRAEAPGEKLLKAIALSNYEPNMARALIKQAFTADWILVLSCLVWPDGSGSNELSRTLLDRVVIGKDRDLLLKTFEKHISGCADVDSLRLTTAWCSSKEKARLLWSVYPLLELPFKISLPSEAELEEVMDNASALNGHIERGVVGNVVELEGADYE
jgi:hypothetical protein